jgi:putative endonuclease
VNHGAIFVRWLKPFFKWWKRLRQPLSLGKRGEREAERHLKRQGYVILARGDRARLGEIDLVAVEKRTVVFVEVKTRTSHDAGHPAEAVDRNKQRRLTRAAQGYLKRHRLGDCLARFDVIAVTWPDLKMRPQIEHFRHAFESAD